MIKCAVHYEHRTSLPVDMGHLMCLTESGHDVHDDAVLFIVTGPAAWIGLRDARSGSLGGGHVVTERDRVLVARARWIRLIGLAGAPSTSRSCRTE